MKGLLFIFLIFFVGLQGHRVDSIYVPTLSEVGAIIKFCEEVLSKVKEAYNLYQKYFEHEKDDMQIIMAQISDIPEKLDQMEGRLSHQMDVMVQTLLDRLPLVGKLDASMRELHNYIVRVDGIYDNYVYYAKNTSNYNDYTIRRFIKSVTSEQLGDLQDVLNKIHRLVIPGRTSGIRKSLLLLLSEQTAASYLELCDDTLSPAQQLFELYSTIALTEIRGYAMTAFVYGLILPQYENANFTAELDKSMAKMAIRSSGYLQAIKKAMQHAPRDIRRCDPKSNKRNETFFEFEELFQAYIVNEADVEFNSCTKTCPTLTSKRVVTCIDGQYCPHYRRCEGSVTDCVYGGGKMEVCETPDNSRRYQWFKDNDDIVHGSNSEECPGVTKNPKGWVRWFVRCDYCICTCSATDPRSRALRTISFINQVSDIENNMVVTGVKFQLKNKMLQIQMKEGQLMPEGRISNVTERWKPLDKIQWDGDTEMRAKFIRLVGDKKLELVRNVDYDHVTRFHNTIHLDDIILPADHVVTGVRFAHGRRLNNSEPQAFVLEVQATPFDIVAGKLTPTPGHPSRWINAKTMPQFGEAYGTQRTELKLDRPDDPLKSRLNLLDSRANQFVRFRASDFRKDAGQSTIPFFDGQPIETRPAAPLAGVGLSHRGADGFGGFLTLRAFTLDLSDQIQSELPANAMRTYQKLYPELEDYDYSEDDFDDKISNGVS